MLSTDIMKPFSSYTFAVSATGRSDGLDCYSRRQGLRIFGPLFIGFLIILVYFAFCGLSPIGWGSHTLDHNQNMSTRAVYDVYGIEIVNTYHHDPKAFTQGLVYAGNDTLYESTGLYGVSSVREVHLQTGEVIKLHRMKDTYFGEGLTLFDNRLFQVAWRVTSGFIYDAKTLALLNSFQHPMKDGWGLATDGHVIYGSDGSSTIYVMQPFSFAEERRLLVKDQDKHITALNELEYVGNELWANVWTKDCIVRISPKDGQVLGWILLHELSEAVHAQADQVGGCGGVCMMPYILKHLGQRLFRLVRLAARFFAMCKEILKKPFSPSITLSLGSTHAALKRML